MQLLNVCVVGLGYIGLPASSLLANRGYKVHGVDVNAKVVETINQGRIHIVEPDLDILVRSAVHSGNLVASTTPVAADVFVLAVPTPFKEGHQPDLRFVDAATDSVAPVLQPGNLVILESTSPVGTTERVARRLFEQRPDLVGQLFVAHCPERVLPGFILRELVENDRVVGGIDAASTERAVAFYQGFVKGDVLATDARTAEMCKLVENAFRDVNIAFANELSVICHDLGIDVRTLISFANRHPRVNILSPGPGVGGHCIAVDPWFIVSFAPETSRLIRTAREVNDGKEQWVIDRVIERAERFKRPVIACLGLAYKPDIDDLRESPALHIATQLAAKLATESNGEVLFVDPMVPSDAGHGLTLTPVSEALAKADIIVALVGHRAFRDIPRASLEGRVVIDTVGIFR